MNKNDFKKLEPEEKLEVVIHELGDVLQDFFEDFDEEYGFLLSVATLVGDRSKVCFVTNFEDEAARTLCHLMAENHGIAPPKTIN